MLFSRGIHLSISRRPSENVTKRMDRGLNFRGSFVRTLFSVTSHSIDGLISSKLVDNSSCKFHSGSKIRSSDSSELFRFSLVTRSQPRFFSAPYSSINSVLVIPSDPTSYRRDYRLLNPLDPPANAFDDSLIAIVDRWQRQATVSWQRNANRLISTARSGRATLM